MSYEWLQGSQPFWSIVWFYSSIILMLVGCIAIYFVVKRIYEDYKETYKTDYTTEEK